MNKNTEFKLIFMKKKDRSHTDDWRIILKTTEPKTDEEIASLVDYWIEVNKRNLEEYNPYDVIIDLCEDKGWS